MDEEAEAEPVAAEYRAALRAVESVNPGIQLCGLLFEHGVLEFVGALAAASFRRCQFEQTLGCCLLPATYAVCPMLRCFAEDSLRFQATCRHMRHMLLLFQCNGSSDFELRQGCSMTPVTLMGCSRCLTSEAQSSLTSLSCPWQSSGPGRTRTFGVIPRVISHFCVRTSVYPADC